MVTILLPPGEVIKVTLEDTDGEFTIDFDSKGDNTLTVNADLPDSSGRVGVIYLEDFGEPPCLPES